MRNFPSFVNMTWQYCSKITVMDISLYTWEFSVLILIKFIVCRKLSYNKTIDIISKMASTYLYQNSCAIRGIYWVRTVSAYHICMALVVCIVV